MSNVRAWQHIWIYQLHTSTVTNSFILMMQLPVFWGPTTINLGSLSHVFSLDQISLCLLSSQGFCTNPHKSPFNIRYRQRDQSANESLYTYTQSLIISTQIQWIHIWTLPYSKVFWFYYFIPCKYIEFAETSLSMHKISQAFHFRAHVQTFVCNNIKKG